MLVKVDNSQFVRDTNSMALLNTNNNERNEYYAKVRMIQNQKSEINTVKAEVQEIRQDMAEVKMLLQKLLEGRNG